MEMLHVGTLSDPAYLACLERDITAYEKATETDPESRRFHAWIDAEEQDRNAGLICRECYGPVVYNGLCHAHAWELYDERRQDGWEPQSYAEKHGV